MRASLTALSVHGPRLCNAVIRSPVRLPSGAFLKALHSEGVPLASARQGNYSSSGSSSPASSLQVESEDMQDREWWDMMREQAEQPQDSFQVKVVAANRGGLVVTLDGRRGFIPRSRLAKALRESYESVDSLIGQELPVVAIEVDEAQERLIFSHKGHVNDNDSCREGDVVSGVVRNVTQYGAFVDLDGGQTALLHVSQISQERIHTVDQVFEVGHKVTAIVLRVDKERGRISLSTRKLEKEPGDFLRDPQLVYDNAEQQAQQIRDRIKKKQQEAAFASDDATA